MAQTKAHKQKLDWKDCALIVAHPDDETLWAGGTILMHPEANWTIITLCRKSDPDRSVKFFNVMKELGAVGAMGDIGDGPEQIPQDRRNLQNTILDLLPPRKFDLIITHGPWGEYTRHLKHEETGKEVMALWESERLFAKQVWRFAYEDGEGKYLPRVVQDADLKIRLPDEIWKKKYDIITNVYGFAPDSFEARTTPQEEAFWCFGRD
jgi:LmbE family N-acetylglucosaminyl deacetylase